LMCLAYGVSLDTQDDYLRMSEYTCHNVQVLRGNRRGVCATLFESAK
jgi:hypothetical protein